MAVSGMDTSLFIQKGGTSLHPYVLLLARLTLGTMWIIAGLAKLLKGEPRSQVVAGFRLLPGRAASTVGTALPWVELTLGTLLILGQWTTPAAQASLGLLFVFSLAIVINLLRGNLVECNCFGQLGSKPISWWSVARNLGLLAVGALVTWYPSQYLAADGWWNGSTARWVDPPVRDFVPVLFMVLAGVLIWLLASSAWHAARAVAQAEAGPALAMAERQRLQKLMRVTPPEPPPAAEGR